ncbi:MAG TPA: hypothetical protein VI688_07110 [Anaerolineales bacterium]|nr:hypothetical protein [Anaerolineales bacterium]HLE73996.1 hypothetical protein [Anaerolineales bacterium]
MLRRVATFALWLGLFGSFLTFAAYSVGELRFDLAAGSLLLLFFAWLVLRKPVAPYRPDARFRTLRKLGLIGHAEDKGAKGD